MAQLCVKRLLEAVVAIAAVTGFVNSQSLLQPGALTSTPFDALPVPLLSCYFNGTHDGCEKQLVSTSTLSLVGEQSWTKALNCQTQQNALPILHSIPYGSTGPFAISLWFKQLNATGRGYQYLFSHAPGNQGGIPISASNPAGLRRLQQSNINNVPASDKASTAGGIVPPQTATVASSILVTRKSSEEGGVQSGGAFVPNQVQVFLPSEQNLGTGIVRTLVRDSTDAGKSATFLDSDGMINNFDGVRNDINFKQVYRGQWQHLVVTTHPYPGAKGYAIYLDGAMAMLMPRHLAAGGTADEKNTPFDIAVTGGGPMDFSGGNIYLCQGSDMFPSSQFQGLISHLRIYNSSLLPHDVVSLYQLDREAMTDTGRAHLVQAAIQQLHDKNASAVTTAPDSPDASFQQTQAGNGARSDLEAGDPSGMLADGLANPNVQLSETTLPLLDGELMSGISTADGLWASMAPLSPSFTQTLLPNLTFQNPLLVACDGSSASGLPLPMSAPQLLPQTGFTLSAWLRLPVNAMTSNAPGATGSSNPNSNAPWPIFSLIGVQQAAVVQALRKTAGTTQGAEVPRRSLLQAATSAAAGNPSQTTSSTLVLPLSVHAYILPTPSDPSVPVGDLQIAVNVAVIEDAMTVLAQGGTLTPVVQTYHAALPSRTLLGPAVRHIAVSATPNTLQPPATLAYNVYIDGHQLAVATLMDSSNANSNDTAWLLYRGAQQLQTMASTGSTGLLYVCGESSSSSTTSPASAMPQTGLRRLQQTAGDSTSSTLDPGANQQAKPSTVTALHVLPSNKANNAVLVTDVRVYQVALASDVITAIWSAGPGAADVAGSFQQPLSGAASSDPAMPASGSDAPGRWVRSGPGYVPHGTLLDTSVTSPTFNAAEGNTAGVVGTGHGMNVQLPEDLPDYQPDATQASVIPGHGVDVVLPEDAAKGKSGQTFSNIVPSNQAADQNQDGMVSDHTVQVEQHNNKKLAVGLGVGLGAAALVAFLAIAVFLLPAIRKRQSVSADQGSLPVNALQPFDVHGKSWWASFSLMPRADKDTIVSLPATAHAVSEDTHAIQMPATETVLAARDNIQTSVPSISTMGLLPSVLDPGQVSSSAEATGVTAHAKPPHRSIAGAIVAGARSIGHVLGKKQPQTNGEVDSPSVLKLDHAAGNPADVNLELVPLATQQGSSSFSDRPPSMLMLPTHKTEFVLGSPSNVHRRTPRITDPGSARPLRPCLDDELDIASSAAEAAAKRRLSLGSSKGGAKAESDKSTPRNFAGGPLRRSLPGSITDTIAPLLSAPRLHSNMAVSSSTPSATSSISLRGQSLTGLPPAIGVGMSSPRAVPHIASSDGSSEIDFAALGSTVTIGPGRTQSSSAAGNAGSTKKSLHRLHMAGATTSTVPAKNASTPGEREHDA